VGEWLSKGAGAALASSEGGQGRRRAEDQPEQRQRNLMRYQGRSGAKGFVWRHEANPERAYSG
jgi:hypothetical protein